MHPYPLINQLTSPDGFWVCAGNPNFCKRIPELRSAASCGPSDKTGIVSAVTAPTVPGPGDCIPPLIFVRFKCPDFGVNSMSMHLNQWPLCLRRLGKRRIISAELFGSLV